ncbi:MAG TPA: AMP-binding protein [Thermodesulfobacteriota bacterium]|nr:AMP-binding protein [Thermodesulfobacteriota bacterium]
MIVEKLEYWAKKQPEKVALQIKYQSGYERVTYLELWNRCLYAASQLRAYGMGPGDNIALYGENSPAWVISYLAIHMLGGIVVPLDSQIGAKDVLPFLSFSQVKSVLVDEIHQEKLEPLLTDFPSKIQLISIESLCGGSETADGFSPFVKEPDDLMSIIFTSGTTGTPKGVQLTRRNIESNVEAVLSQIKVTPEENILNILPLHHSFACTMGLLTPLFAGATVTFSHSLRSTDLLSVMRETEVSIFPGVPKLFTLLDREIFKKVDSLGVIPRTIFWTLYRISKWFRETTGIRLGKFFFRQVHAPFGKKLRFFASGGAKLEPGVSERFLNLGLLILEGYGLTETSPVISLTPPGNPKPGTVGCPIPGVEVRVASPDEEDTGEICVRGPNVMKGYYKNESATEEVFRGGWFHTGDLGMIDPEGNIVITGRAKEVIVLPSGKNIYPEEIEKQYEGIPFVKELCVLPSVANDGSVKGLRMVAVPDVKELSTRAVFNPRERIRSEITGIGSRLPSYMQITELVLFYDELPRTRLGKLRRNEIEKLLKEQKPLSNEEQLTLSAEEKTLMEAPSSERFLRRLQDISGVSGPFHPEQDLSIDLGLDSLTLIQITVLLENEFGVKLKEEELSSVRTIGDVLKRIQDVSSEHAFEEKDHSMKNLLAEPPTVPLEEFFNVNRGTIKRTGVRIVQAFISLIVRIAFRVRVEGLHKIPKHGAVLICPNHQSYIDPILIFALIPGRMLDRLVFVGFGEIFRRPPLSWISRPARLIPTGSAGTLGESLKLSYEGLKRGMAVCIFPEGGRTTTGEIMSPRLGTGILSVEAQAPVVPILIEGAINTLSHLHPGFKLPKVQIIVGDPIYPPTGDNAGELYQEAVDRWKESVLELENRISAASRQSVVRNSS